jgi:hypothetical protein
MVVFNSFLKVRCFSSARRKKAGLILFGKEAIYTAEGDPLITNISEVGRYKPYQETTAGTKPESLTGQLPFLLV